MLYDDCDAAARKLSQELNKRIFIGVPLGLGKPLGILNALYRMACIDKHVELTIITGLTLARPDYHNEMEKRFIEPILNRVLRDYEDPLYEKDRVLQRVPANIKILEFFLSPGKFLNNNYVQQHYISTKYTSAARDILSYPINAIAQMVARSPEDPHCYSLSCNADLFHDVARGLNKLKKMGNKIAILAEVNENLPFMYGDAEVHEQEFTDIIDTRHYKSLFAMPREALSVQDHFIGLYTSCLIKDDSCLQIGIGKLGNAVANALLLRHQENVFYRRFLEQLAAAEKFADTMTSIDSLTPFHKGLCASTEMFSDEYLALYKAGILKKRVYDHVGLQRLLNLGLINDMLSPDIFDKLLEHHIVQPILTSSDFEFLQHFGILKSTIQYQDGYLLLASGEKIKPDLLEPRVRQRLQQDCLGQRLQNGKILHAAFFIGSTDFYRQLKQMPKDKLQQMNMTSVTRTNALSWAPELLKLQRQNARFINTAMMISLGGTVVSDGLKNFIEVSGVGGQFDFVEMAQALPDARSIIVCRSTRKTRKGIQSSIVWDYPNITIPRYLRDIVITEYGIADCRAKTDAEIIKSLVNISDSRFQKELLEEAKHFGKIPFDYEIPPRFKHNYPEFIQDLMHAMHGKEYFQSYPFGSDLTPEEIILQRALLLLKNSSKLKLFCLSVIAIFYQPPLDKFKKYLVRMQLIAPRKLNDWFYKKLLMLSLRPYI